MHCFRRVLLRVLYFCCCCCWHCLKIGNFCFGGTLHWMVCIFGEASSSWLRLPSGSIIRPLLRGELTEGQDQEQDHQQESHYMYLLRNRISFGGLLSQSESAAAAAAGFWLPLPIRRVHTVQWLVTLLVHDRPRHRSRQNIQVYVARRRKQQPVKE